MSSLIDRLPPLREGETFHWWCDEHDSEILWVEFQGYGTRRRRAVSTDAAYYARFDLLREEIAVPLIQLRAAAKKP